MRYLEVQFPYLLRQRDSVDKFVLAVQRAGDNERAWVRRMEREHPGKFEVVEVRRPHQDSASVSPLLREKFNDEDTLYVKLDDDIVFIEDGTLDAMFRYKEDHPECAIVYPNIINNTVTSYLHQHRFVFDRNRGTCSWSSWCGTSWKGEHFAEHVHRTFLRDAFAGNLDAYRFPPFPLLDYQRMSIGAICYSGAQLRKILGRLSDDCEVEMAVILPKAFDHPPVVLGEKIVSHFSYHTQDGHLGRTDVLEQYRRLAQEYGKNDPH